MVNFEWYRSFIHVYRAGTATKAAQILHLTQPAVSQHISALEAALGETLFQRSPRQMLPTEAGKRLYTQVVDAVEKLETVPTRNTSDPTPLLIRLGTPQEFFIERVLKQLSPGAFYTVRFGLAQDLIDQLLEGQLDVVIATQKIARVNLDYHLIYEESFWLVAPTQIVVPTSQEILQANLNSLEEWLRTQAWLAYSEELPIIRRFWRVVFGCRIDVRPTLILPDLRGIRSAITAGFGFSVLPDYLCDETQLQIILKPKKAVTNQIWLVYRKSEQREQVLQVRSLFF